VDDIANTECLHSTANFHKYLSSLVDIDGTAVHCLSDQLHADVSAQRIEMFSIFHSEQGQPIGGVEKWSTKCQLFEQCREHGVRSDVVSRRITQARRSRDLGISGRTVHANTHHHSGAGGRHNELGQYACQLFAIKEQIVGPLNRWGAPRQFEDGGTGRQGNGTDNVLCLVETERRA
jgi:hypothetical protein